MQSIEQTILRACTYCTNNCADPEKMVTAWVADLKGTVGGKTRWVPGVAILGAYTCDYKYAANDFQKEDRVDNLRTEGRDDDISRELRAGFQALDNRLEKLENKIFK